MPRLQVLNGKRQGATFDIGRGGAVIGHRNTAPISIDDPWVSWDHARVFAQGDAFWVEDLGSTNGTFVNCVRIKRERLNHEDIVFFGKTHVIFLALEGAAASADGPGAFEEKKGRSSFELNVEAVAAAAQWSQPAPAPARDGRNGKAPSQSAAPALPVPPGERARIELGPPTGLEPGEESSRAGIDPFRPGADPWEKAPPPGPARGSSALVNLAPDADPFSSARAEQEKRERELAGDPFSVGEDPFEGPRARSFKETQHDRDENAPRSASNRPTSEDGAVPKKRSGFSNFDIDENEPDPQPMTPVSAGEISSLLEGKRSNDGDAGAGAGLDDLDALLGDGAARTPDPGLIPPDLRRTTEMRPVESPQGRRATSAAVPTGTSRFPAPTISTPAAAGGAGGRDGGRTQPLPVQDPVAADAARSEAELAFEVAKLQDQVRRLHLALEAAKQGDPEKVRVAVEALRAEELARQAREIAGLRRELAGLKNRHTKTQAELDDVTTDMISKEDTIDALKSRIGELEGSGGGSQAKGGADPLRALEF